MESKKSRGAPPGNKNALKHGFYSNWFTSFESQSLDSQAIVNLESEINLLRVFLSRVLAYSKTNPPPDLKTYISLLHAVSLAASKLASIARSQAFLCPERAKFEIPPNLIDEVLEELQTNPSANPAELNPEQLISLEVLKRYL